MSRLYDAKQAALKAYPKDVESGVDLFIDMMNASQGDIEYELGMTIGIYVYGTDLKGQQHDN